jgi:predicted nucleic-acid-binding protein
MARFKTEEILTILVNFSYSLSPEASSIFEIANTELAYRLDTNFDPEHRDLYVKYEDFPKILNTLLDHKRLEMQLKDAIFDYIKDNVGQFSYPILSEIAVIYSMKMDKVYRDSFFFHFKDRFMKELEYLDSETMYKIIWSLIKSEAIIVNDSSSDWTKIKDIVIKKVKTLDA